MTFISNKKGSLKQWSVEYVVSGMLDGVTTAPAANDAAPNEEGVAVVAASNLGIIDPDLFGGRAARGDRQIVWLRIESAVPFPIGFEIWRVDATLSPPRQIQRISPASIVGQTIFTTTECLYIPQGQALQIIRGAANPVGLPARVSIGVRGASSADDEARMMSACCCQSGGGAGSGGGGGGGIPSPQRHIETFSTQSFTTPGADNGTYFGFGAYYFNPTPLTFMQQSNAIFNADEGTISPAAIKLMIRAGSVTNIAILTTFALGFTGQPFIEISTGGGAFVRTFLTAAPQVFAVNTVTIVPCTGGAWAVADRIRVGINITTEVLLSDLFAEVEITSTE